MYLVLRVVVFTQMIAREPISGQVEETPLACACALGFLEVVKMLVDAGADTNYKCSVSCSCMA